MKEPHLTQRQTQIAERVAKGLPTKAIARDLGLSVRTVEEHIRLAAERVPGTGWPRHKLVLWVLTVSD